MSHHGLGIGGGWLGLCGEICTRRSKPTRGRYQKLPKELAAAVCCVPHWVIHEYVALRCCATVFLAVLLLFAAVPEKRLCRDSPVDRPRSCPPDFPAFQLCRSLLLMLVVAVVVVVLLYSTTTNSHYITHDRLRVSALSITGAAR